MRTQLVLMMWIATLQGVGQSWFPEGATWYYDYRDGFPPLHVGYIRMQVAGDTILGQVLAMKLEKRRSYWVVGTSQMYEESYGTHVVNESDGLVRIWVPSEEAYDTLYDMRAVPGDRWQLAPLSAPIVCDPSSYAQVLDTGHVTIDGLALRWLAVDHHYLLDGSDYTVWTDTIIERMGLNLSYFTPHEICNGAVDGGEGGALRCYSDTEISYNRFEPWSCEFVLSVADKPLPIEKLAVWPNPGNDALYLNSAGRPLLSVELRDALGRVVLERTSNLNNKPIDVSSLAPGTYVVLARTAQGVRAVANWVKQ